MSEHENKEHEKSHKGKNEIEIKKSTLILVSASVIMLIVGISIGYLISSFSRPSLTGNIIDKNEVGQKVIKYINENLVQPGTTATLSSVTEENGLYVVNTQYQGNNIPVYVDKSGNLLFTSAPLLLNESLNLAGAQKPKEIPKTSKPEVQLFVMSFCPFGVQAEQIMKPVVDKLGEKADIKIRFIANVRGDTVDSVDSLHGPLEAQEDLRQVCIMKYYPKDYWNYLMDINTNCYPTYRNGNLDACWKAAANKLGFDVQKIETCANGKEGLDLLKADEALTNKYGVTGSPTLIINGVVYEGVRSSEAYQSAICSAFITPPAECGETVQSVAVAAQGNC